MLKVVAEYYWAPLGAFLLPVILGMIAVAAGRISGDTLIFLALIGVGDAFLVVVLLMYVTQHLWLNNEHALIEVQRVERGLASSERRVRRLDDDKHAVERDYASLAHLASFAVELLMRIMHHQNAHIHFPNRRIRIGEDDFTFDMNHTKAFLAQVGTRFPQLEGRSSPPRPR